MTELAQALDEARWVRYDEERGLILIWKGGHGINAYTLLGKHASFWNTGDFTHQDADLETVKMSMDLHIHGVYAYP